MTSYPSDANISSGATAATRGLVAGRLVGPVFVRWIDHVIVEVTVGPEARQRAEEAGLDHELAEHSVLSPGLIDWQVNGALGIDLVNADADELRTVSDLLCSRGVTSYCPTAVSAPLNVLVDFATRLRVRSPNPSTARTLGVHLEGPFLARSAAGAHPIDHLHPPTREEAESVRATPGIAVMTVAPELPGALALIEMLSSSGVVVSLGHTAATSTDARAALDAGASAVTHLFNAMPALHHREPGLVGTALTDQRATIGLIADGVHVHDDVVRLAFGAAPDRIALVSDATAAAAMPPGSYDVGATTFIVDDDGRARTPAGTLAGSTVLLDDCVRHCISVGIDPALALRAATETPARMLGRGDIGRLAAGCHADLARWSANWSVERVHVNGSVVDSRTVR